MNNRIMQLPAVALRGACVLPGSIAHFDINRERSKQAVERAMLSDQQIFLVTQKKTETEMPGIDDVYRMGTIATVKQAIKLPKGMLRILIEGTGRAEVTAFLREDTYIEAEVIRTDAVKEQLSPETEEAMRGYLRDLFLSYCEATRLSEGNLPKR